MTTLQKKIISLRRFFETNLDFINHPLQDFWNFPPTFPKYFQIFSQISIFGEFRYLCLKFGTFSINIHGEKCFQSCTLFGSFFNFHIVHCKSLSRNFSQPCTFFSICPHSPNVDHPLMSFWMTFTQTTDICTKRGGDRSEICSYSVKITFTFSLNL